MHWPWITQASHIEGLMTLVRLRDSVDRIKPNRHIQRVVAWADILHAIATNLPPQLGATQYTTNQELKRLMDVVKRHGHSRVLSKISAPAYFQEVLGNLQALVVAKSLLEKKVISNSQGLRPIFSNLLVTTEYLILELGHKRISSDFGLESVNGVEAVKAAALIFTCHGLRDMAITAAFFEILIEQLRDGIGHVFGHFSRCIPPMFISNGAPAAPFLLWLCLNGWKACATETRQTLQSDFVEKAAIICKMAEIKSLDELDSCIGRMSLMTKDCSQCCSDLWADIETLVASHDYGQTCS